MADLIPFPMGLFKEELQTLQLSGNQITVADFGTQLGDFGFEAFDVVSEYLNVAGEHHHHSDIARDMALV